MIFLQPCFFSNRRCWIFHWLSTLAKRRRGVGAASFFWRGREKTVLNTWEEDDWWVLWVYFSAWKLTVDVLFFHILVPTEKKAACISDCADPLFWQISKYIYQTNFTLRMVNAHNNKPFLSKPSLACHSYYNHLFPDVHECSNSGLCLIRGIPKDMISIRTLLTD